MPDLNPEPKMMRSQQDKDAPEHIAEDETVSDHAEKSDVDPASGKDREAAKRGKAEFAHEQMDAIFEENRRGRVDGGDRSASDGAGKAARDGGAGLTRGGRSKL